MMIKKRPAGIPGVDLRVPASGINNPILGDVGIEIELEGRNLRTTLPRHTFPSSTGQWVSKEDGSLRSGREYVVSSPIYKEEIAPVLSQLYTLLAEPGNVRYNLSNRCSTHVHVNASQWRVNLVTSFIALWAIVEPAIIRWNGIERVTNHFCLSVRDSSATVEAWARFLATGDRGWPNGLKYSALNILRLHDLGSIEIRVGKAVTAPEEITPYVRFIAGLASFAEERGTDPSTIPEILSQFTASGLIREICNREGIPEFYDSVCAANGGMFSTDDIDKEGRLSFREVRHLCYGFPWKDFLSEINRAYVPNPFAKPKAKSGARFGEIRMPDETLDAFARAAMREPRWALPRVTPARPN